MPWISKTEKYHIAEKIAMSVQQMTNDSGRTVKNQFILRDGDTVCFQSYSSIIAKKQNGKVFLDKTYWDYSVTTGKYRNIFLGETKKETERKIKDGTYSLVNLN